MCKLSCSVP
nr:unnamed protein product [Callosobruchus analis]